MNPLLAALLQGSGRGSIFGQSQSQMASPTIVDQLTSLVEAGARAGAGTEQGSGRAPRRGTMTDFLARMFGGLTQQTSAPAVTPASTESNPAVGAERVGKTSMVSGTTTPAPTMGATEDPVAVDLPPEARAMLNAIAGPESSGRYNVRFGGEKGPQTFEGNQHPNIREAGPHGPSSAAGRYQFTGTTWRSMGGGDFTPEAQDRRAWELAQADYKRRTGKDLLQELQTNGLTDTTMRVLAPTWQGWAGPKGREQGAAAFRSSLERFRGEGRADAGGMEFSSQRRSPSLLSAHRDGPPVGMTPEGLPGREYNTGIPTPQAQQTIDPWAGNNAILEGALGSVPTNIEGMRRSTNIEDHRERDPAQGDPLSKFVQRMWDLDPNELANVAEGWTQAIRGNPMAGNVEEGLQWAKQGDAIKAEKARREQDRNNVQMIDEFGLSSVDGPGKKGDRMDKGQPMLNRPALGPIHMGKALIDHMADPSKGGLTIDELIMYASEMSLLGPLARGLRDLLGTGKPQPSPVYTPRNNVRRQDA